MIEIVSLDNAAELDEFVRGHRYCHFMQTSLWGRVKNDWGWQGLICRRDGVIRGTMVLLRHHIRHLNTCMLYAPRGPIFDPDDLDTFRELVQGAKNLAQSQHAYLLRLDPRLRATNHPFETTARSLGFTIDQASDYSLFQPRMCYVKNLEGLTAETLSSSYHRSTRYNTNLAQRRGVTVRRGELEDLPTFCKLMKETADKNDFVPKTYEHFAHYLTALGDYAQFYVAEKEGQIIAAAIAVTYGNRMWHMYGCSHRDNLKDRPNEAIQLTMQRDAIAAGCRWFDFRGVEGYPTEENPKLGLHQYKQGFGGEFREYIGQLDFILRPAVAKLMGLYAKFR